MHTGRAGCKQTSDQYYVLSFILAILLSGEAGTLVPASLFDGRTDENRGYGWCAGCGKNGRSGSSSKHMRVPEPGDRTHSACFLMKTHLKTPSSSAGYGVRCPCFRYSHTPRRTMPSLYIFTTAGTPPISPILILFSDLLLKKEAARRRLPLHPLIWFWYLPEFFTK